MRIVHRLVPLVAGGVLTVAGFATTSAHAGQVITGVVSSKASDLTPSVPGGQCNPGANQDKCRRILVLKQIGNWIYAGGIISSVTDRTTGVTTSGFHNIFRFSATTHKVDTSWRPQFYKSAQANTTTAYLDSAVTGISSDGGHAIYVAGQFTQVARAPGAPGVTRRGVAAVSTTDGSLLAFDAGICEGGGGCHVDDVAAVKGRLWLGGDFTHLAHKSATALAFVNPVTGALTGSQLPVSGQVTTTTGTKVTQFTINPQKTQAVMIGNFTSVGGKSHHEVAVLNVTSTGGATVNSWNDPTNLNASDPPNCRATEIWAHGVDWDPTGVYFDIAAGGGGGFNAFAAHGALCDAFSRFKSDGNPNTRHPLIVNVTGFDSLYTVCDTGRYVYTGGHNKFLNHAVYINGVQVPATQEAHHGIGAIDVKPSDPGYGRAVSSFNRSITTGRGAGWASSLSITSSGLYIGGDAQRVGADKTIKRLAFFPVNG